jgi:quercetin dioxygenase-like cupin family protein
MASTFPPILSPRGVTIVTKFFCITAIRMITYYKYTNTSGGHHDRHHADNDLGRPRFGPLVMFVTKISETDDYCVAHSMFHTGVFVPIHSHEDRETFYVISGKLEYWNARECSTLTAGDVADVPKNHVRAWRNVSGDDATCLFVTTTKMGRFFAVSLRTSWRRTRRCLRVPRDRKLYRNWEGSPPATATGWARRKRARLPGLTNTPIN